MRLVNEGVIGSPGNCNNWVHYQILGHGGTDPAFGDVLADITSDPGYGDRLIDLSSNTNYYPYYSIKMIENGADHCGFGMNTWEGYGDILMTPTPTGTVTPTGTNTPTFTDTPTDRPTFTSTPTNTPTASDTATAVATSTPTAIGYPWSTNTPGCEGCTPVPLPTQLLVAGICGGPGQPPCVVTFNGTPQPITGSVTINGTVVVTGSVNITNWPTPVPTNTPYGGPAQATAAAVATGAPVSGVGSTDLGIGGLLNYDANNSDAAFLRWHKYDFGCPINISQFNTTLCFTYTEISEANMLGIALPLFIGPAVLAAIVLKMLLQA
jgi:hypothetical protein